MSKTQYQVVSGALKIPRAISQNHGFVKNKDFIHQGEVIPEGVFPQTDIDGWIQDGLVREVQEGAPQVSQVQLRSASKWTVDPSTLVSKSLDELRIMVLEIDPAFEVNTILNEQSAIGQLSLDWEPDMSDIIAPVSDRTRPENINMKLEQKGGLPATTSGSREMSAEAKAIRQSALDRAKAKASAPKHDDDAVDAPKVAVDSEGSGADADAASTDAAPQE